MFRLSGVAHARCISLQALPLRGNKQKILLLKSNFLLGPLIRKQLNGAVVVNMKKVYFHDRIFYVDLP